MLCYQEGLQLFLTSMQKIQVNFLKFIFAPSRPRYLQYRIMILQLIRIIVEDAGFETGTDESAVWRNTIEPKLHYQLAATNAKFFCLYFISVYFISPVTVVEFLSKLLRTRKRS